jgi:hypothetical protein
VQGVSTQPMRRSTITGRNDCAAIGPLNEPPSGLTSSRYLTAETWTTPRRATSPSRNAQACHIPPIRPLETVSRMPASPTTPQQRLLYVANKDYAFMMHGLPTARAARGRLQGACCQQREQGAAAIAAERFTLHPIPLLSLIGRLAELTGVVRVHRRGMVQTQRTVDTSRSMLRVPGCWSNAHPLVEHATSGAAKFLAFAAAAAHLRRRCWSSLASTASARLDHEERSSCLADPCYLGMDKERLMAMPSWTRAGVMSALSGK